MKWKIFVLMAVGLWIGGCAVLTHDSDWNRLSIRSAYPGEEVDFAIVPVLLHGSTYWDVIAEGTTPAIVEEDELWGVVGPFIVYDRSIGPPQLTHELYERITSDSLSPPIWRGACGFPWTSVSGPGWQSVCWKGMGGATGLDSLLSLGLFNIIGAATGSNVYLDPSEVVLDPLASDMDDEEDGSQLLPADQIDLYEPQDAPASRMNPFCFGQNRERIVYRVDPADGESVSINFFFSEGVTEPQPFVIRDPTTEDGDLVAAGVANSYNTSVSLPNNPSSIYRIVLRDGTYHEIRRSASGRFPADVDLSGQHHGSLVSSDLCFLGEDNISAGGTTDSPTGDSNPDIGICQNCVFGENSGVVGDVDATVNN